MSVTLRLEGLPLQTTTNDVREFFAGLDIPKGGVHIIGGLNGEALVDITTWDDAYRALQMSGLQIRKSTIKVFALSEEDKQQTLEDLQKRKDSALDRYGGPEKRRRANRRVRRNLKFFLRLDIADFLPTEDDVKNFFDGANIKDILIYRDEVSSGGTVVFVMFDNRDDATEGFYRYKESNILPIRWASGKEWMKYGGKMDIKEDEGIPSTSESSRTRSRSPQRQSNSPRKHSPPLQQHYRFSY